MTDDERDERDPLLGLFAEQRAASGPTPAPPRSRREAREAARRLPPPRRPRRRWVVPVTVTVVVLCLLGVGGSFAWSAFQPQIQALVQASEPNDYAGRGEGRVTVVIRHGDIGSDVATTLHERGVTKSFDAFYDLLLAQGDAAVFQPGVYALKKHMSARAALKALEDPDNRLSHAAAIPEGTTEKRVLEIVAKAASIPPAALQKAAQDVASFGLPPQAKSLEGFLFPATYTFDPGVSAHDALQRLVDRAVRALDEAGVPPDRRWHTVVLASIVEREAGADPEDLGKIARVFTNRLQAGMPLQSDATVTYGTGNTDTVWTTDAERRDASNPYNTYVHKGLPPGPIGNPGQAAIEAALHPTPGDWLYFVTVNLKTGRTVFSSTLEGHEAAVAKLRRWCKDPAHAEYCT